MLLTPGTGVCKPACGKQAARYRQMAAAVDEAAQTNPTVSPFDPAVREMRLLCCASGVANTGQRLWSTARAFDVIVLMKRRCNFASSLIHPRSTGSLGVHDHAAAETCLHTDYEQELVLLFAKVQRGMRQGAKQKRMLLIVSRSSPSSWACSFVSNAVCFAVRALR